MKKLLYIIVLTLLIFLGCSKKEETSPKMEQAPKARRDKPVIVESDPTQTEPQPTSYAVNENIYPRLAESRLEGYFARGLPKIQANRFHKSTKVINKFADISQQMASGKVDMDKIVWELNTIVQKNGFEDLADYVENFSVLATAHGTYQRIKMLDAMIAGGAEEQKVEMYEEKIKQSFADQQLSREDLRFIHNNKEKFARTMEVMDTLAKQSMEAGF
ncbi:MAG: hypothetical protein R6U84_01195 [Candidatus Cloacimonadales bacterium]